MKNVQSSTPGFVLTSLSFRQYEEQNTAQNSWHQEELPHHSSIAKFDYCLPPEETKTADAGKQTKAA